MSNTFLAAYKADVLKAIESVDLAEVAETIEVFRRARNANRQIFVCGNGVAHLHRLT
jgi:hypothetical protein